MEQMDQRNIQHISSLKRDLWLRVYSDASGSVSLYLDTAMLYILL